MLAATPTDQEFRLNVLRSVGMNIRAQSCCFRLHLIRNEKALPTLRACRVGCILPTFLRLAKDLFSDHRRRNDCTVIDVNVKLNSDFVERGRA